MSTLPVLPFGVREAEVACIIPHYNVTVERANNFKLTSEYYGQRFEVFRGKADTTGQARNVGAYEAIRKGYKYLFFVDSDMVVSLETVMLATNYAQMGGSGVLPYGPLTRIQGVEKEKCLDFEALRSKRTKGTMEAGALILSTDAFISICGWPQITYGEDAILHNVLTLLRGPVARILDDGFHLHHTPTSYRHRDHKIDQVIRATELATEEVVMKNIIQRCRYYDIEKFKTLGYVP